MRVNGRHKMSFNGEKTNSASAPYVYYVVQYRKEDTDKIKEWGRRYNIVRWEAPDTDQNRSWKNLDDVFEEYYGQGWFWFYQRNGFRTVKAFTHHPASFGRAGTVVSLYRGGGD